MDGDLARAWKRLKKKYGWDAGDTVEAYLREDMVKFAPVPRNMGEELAAFFLSSPVDEEAVYKAEEILEILTGSWAPVNSALEIDDWEFIKEQVNAWAMDMDMDVVTEVMRLVVDRGGFSEGQ